MPDYNVQELEDLRNQSIQRADKSEPAEATSGTALLNLFVRAGEIIPPWWSKARDTELRRTWMKCDYIAGTLYSLISRLTTIPRLIVAKDPTIERHRLQAEERLHNLETISEFEAGFNVFAAKFWLDFLTQDNGAFAEVVGGGRADGPLIGWPMGLTNLDSARCQRTGNPEYPVFYTNKTGERYKLHYTRVIMRSSMPSPDIRMNNVGFCGVSRVINIGQVLIDILQYKQEKLGSRPPRAILVGSNISTQDIMKAFRDADIGMNNAQLSRFARIVAIGNDKKEIKLDVQDLASIPDGFNEKDSVQMGMCAIALGFGVDLREIWPATITGATKADAEVMHTKAKGKFFAEALSMMRYDINHKFLPPHLEMLLDYQDDEQDQLQAQIRYTKSQAYEKNLADQAMTIRVVREKMLEGGEINDLQFEMMELSDGRLPDGQSILSLYLSQDPDIKTLLQVKLSDPTKLNSNDPTKAIDALDDQILVANEAYMNLSRESMKRKARQAIGALEYLKKQYMNLAQQKKQEEMALGWQRVESHNQPTLPSPESGGSLASNSQSNPATKPTPSPQRAQEGSSQSPRSRGEVGANRVRGNGKNVGT